MLTSEQFRLTKLGEECSEVIKECSKLSIGGPDNVYNKRRTRSLLREEIMDVLVCVRLLVDMGVIDPVLNVDVVKHYARKRAKIVRRTYQHIEAGTVHEDILNHIPETLP